MGPTDYHKPAVFPELAAAAREALEFADVVDSSSVRGSHNAAVVEADSNFEAEVPARLMEELEALFGEMQEAPQLAWAVMDLWYELVPLLDARVQTVNNWNDFRVVEQHIVAAVR